MTSAFCYQYPEKMKHFDKIRDKTLSHIHKVRRMLKDADASLPSSIYRSLMEYSSDSLI